MYLQASEHRKWSTKMLERDYEKIEKKNKKNKREEEQELVPHTYQECSCWSRNGERVLNN